MARFTAVALLAIVGVACVAADGLGLGLGLGGLGYGGIGLGGLGYGGLGYGGIGLGGIGHLGLHKGIGLGHGLALGKGLALGHHYGLPHIPNYAYTYGVADKLTHDQKQVSEVRKGHVTKNQYSSVLVHPY